MRGTYTRFIAGLLALVMVLALTACGKAAAAEDEPTAAPQSTEAAAQAADETAEENGAAGGGNILIAYFTAAENSGVDAISSASVVTVDDTAKGVSQAVADMIAERTGGELFSIQTSVVYPADMGELIDYVAEEQDAGVLPELTTHIEDLDKYDTVFVGFPIWWYDMPQVMYSFFEEYDFAGKTIIPFTVHNGSRLSGTPATIQELEPEATVIQGRLHRQPSERGGRGGGRGRVAGWPGLLTMVRKLISAVLAAGLLCACGPVGSAAAEDGYTTGQFIRGNVLESAEGEIHYSYWLPDGYDGETEYPLMMTLPGYGGMWFGEDSEGTNLRERGVSVWTGDRRAHDRGLASGHGLARHLRPADHRADGVFS